MNQAATIVHARGTAMLRSALGVHVSGWLDDPVVAEIMLNAHGRLWVDRLDSGMAETGERIAAPQAERIIRLVAHHVGARSMPAHHASRPNCRRAASASRGCSRPS